MNRLLLCACIALVLSGCGGDSTTPAVPQKDHLTLVLDWTPNTNHSGIYLAKARGLYAAANLDVRIIEPGEQGGLPQLAAGNADFAITDSESLIPARARGNDVVSVAAILQHNTSSLVVPADRGVKHPRDLAGKVYGGYGGELEHALLDRLIGCDGGDSKRLKYVEIGETDYFTGFAKRQFDAAWIFDGWEGIRLKQAGSTLTRFPFHPSCVPDWYTPILATRDRVVATRPEIVRRFVTATAQGYEIARRDPVAAAKALVAAVPELDQPLVAESAAYLAPLYADRGRPWGLQDAAVWQRFATFLGRAGIVKQVPRASTLFTNRFLPTS